MKKLAFIVFINVYCLLSAGITVKEQKSILNLAITLHQKQQPELARSSVFTLLRFLPNDQRENFHILKERKIKLAGNEISILQKFTKSILKDQNIPNRYAIELSYTLAHANPILRQEEQAELNSLVAHCYFKDFKNNQINFNAGNIYSKRQIQGNISRLLINQYINEPHKKIPVHLLLLNKLLGLSSVDAQTTHLLLLYNLPIATKETYAKKQFLEFTDKIIPELMNSEIEEERILAFLLDTQKEHWGEELKFKHSKDIIDTADTLLKSVKLSRDIYLPALSPRSITSLAVSPGNLGHDITINSSVTSISLTTSITSANSEAIQLAKLASSVARNINNSQPGLTLHLQTPKGAALEGSSVSLSIALLIKSYTENIVLDPKFTFTGNYTENNISFIGGLPAKIFGAYNSGRTELLIPSRNFKEVNDFALLHGHALLSKIQIFGTDSLEDALSISSLTKSTKTNTAIKLYKQLDSKFTEAELNNILKLNPSHLSAITLLQKLKGKSSDKLTLGTSVEEIKYLTHQVLSKPSTHKQISEVLQKLGKIEGIIHKDCQDFLLCLKTFLKNLQEKSDLQDIRKKLIESGEKVDLLLKSYYQKKLRNSL